MNIHQPVWKFIIIIHITQIYRTIFNIQLLKTFDNKEFNRHLQITDPCKAAKYIQPVLWLKNMYKGMWFSIYEMMETLVICMKKIL